MIVAPTRAAARSAVALLAAAALIVVSPLLAAWLAGRSLAPLLELPPRPAPLAQPPFSAPVFIAVAAVALVALAPIAMRLLRAPTGARRRPFALPWWGYAGIALTAVAWWLAWSRFAWFEPLQRHTFTPLWLGYIVAVNAITQARSGSCLLVSRPRFLLALFPVSALFWWVFEFLNRFVGNWHYVNVSDFGPVEYTVLATMSFSTVLPAVMSTAHCLATFARIDAAFTDLARVRWPAGRYVTAVTLVAGCLALAAAGAWPEFAFALVWVAPPLVIFALGALTGAETGLQRLSAGDWRMVVIPALSALVCGLLWEMWNYWSFARWEYSIPFVERFHIFEMPLLGYAGYIPFGVCCFAVSALVAPLGAADARPGDVPADDAALAPA